MRRVRWRSNSGAAVDFLTRSFSSSFFLFGIFLFFFFAREILRPKDEVYVQSVAGRGLAHIYFLRHPTTSFFFLTPPARPSNKQTKRRKKRPLVFSFFLFFVSSPFSIFLSCKRERRKKNEGRTTFERRALKVWNLISEISVFKSFFISGRDNLAKIFSQFSLNSFWIEIENGRKEKIQRSKFA